MLNSEASTGVDSHGGRSMWGQLRQVCTRRRRELTSPGTIGFPFYFGKKKVSRKIVIVRSSLYLRRGIPWCWANLSVACCRIKYAVGTARGYFAQYHRVPLLLREKRKRPLGPDSPRREKRRLDGGEGAPRGVPEASMREGESESARCRTARLPQAPTPTGVDPAWGQLRQVCIESL